MFGRKKPKQSYDKENQKPVIHASICNGEQVAGFEDMRTGEFIEIMLIKDHGDLVEFAENYGIEISDIVKKY